MSELQIGKKKIGNGYPVYIIAEGCDNHCTYCAIPLIRGETCRSRLH